LKEKKKNPGNARKRESAANAGGNGARSLHQQILADIQDNILSGRWEPGQRIPVEHELVEQYGCARMTVNKVLTQLAQAGIIERRRRAGSFVGRPQSQSAVLAIQDIKSEVDALDLPYRYEILERSKRRATREDRGLLGAEEAVPVLELACLHFAKDQPFCLEYRLINLQAVAGAAVEKFAEISPGAWLLRQVPWNVAEHRIRASGATADVAAPLMIKTGSPCLIVERTTRSMASPITFVRLTYPGNLHELIASFTSLSSQSRSPAAVDRTLKSASL
jgi:GntR family histidine utilization transcriptional repressor